MIQTKSILTKVCSKCLLWVAMSSVALVVIAQFDQVERREILDPSVSRNPVEVGEDQDVDAVPWEMAAEAETIEIGEPLDADDPIDGSESDSVPIDIGRWMDADAPMTGEILDSEPMEIGPPLEVPDSPPSL